ALPASADELISRLKVMVPFNRGGNVVAWIKGRAVQRFDQADLILVDHGSVGEPDSKQAAFVFPALERYGFCQDAISTGREDIHLRPLVSAGAYELLGVLKIPVGFNRSPQQPAG